MLHLGERDTIAAIATATGPAAVGIVRISGPNTEAILARVVGAGLEPRRLSLRPARADAEVIDEVLAVWMPGPASFTGEDSGELHGHGGAIGLQRLLRAVLEAGARQAEPGEFTRRAFENGKLDLTQAEGLLETIAAGSERAHRLGMGLLRGALGDAVRATRDRVVELLASIEADIDFPDDDIEPRERQAALALERSLERLVASATAGIAVTRGISVALVGAVNAGKSSLLNALVGRERSIVADEPGTTRDYVEVDVVWSGLPVTLIDTAGERPEASGVEGRGLELGRQRAGDADVQLVVVEQGHVPPPLEVNQILVWSKGDRAVDVFGDPPGIWTSARTLRGLDELKAAVVAHVLGLSTWNEVDSAVVVSERQRTELTRARDACRRAAEILETRQPTELAAVELSEARQALSAVLGEEVGDEMLDALFARFCIGK